MIGGNQECLYLVGLLCGEWWVAGLIGLVHWIKLCGCLWLGLQLVVWYLGLVWYRLVVGLRVAGSLAVWDVM